VKFDFKLQHYASLALPVAGVVISEVLAEHASGALSLSAHALTALIIAGKVQGLLTVSINPAANARAALATGAVVPAIPTPVDSSAEVTQPEVRRP
jgi:hypothetical protein